MAGSGPGAPIYGGRGAGLDQYALAKRKRAAFLAAYPKASISFNGKSDHYACMMGTNPVATDRMLAGLIDQLEGMYGEITLPGIQEEAQTG